MNLLERLKLPERDRRLNLSQQLAGADPDIVEKFPGEGRRYTGIGTAIMFTGGFATVAMIVFLHDFMHAWLPLAVVLALLWGAGIMALDRWLIISLRRQPKWWATLLAALPRLLLSALVGVVIAEPAVLRVFDTEVRQRAGELRVEHYKEAVAEIDQSFADIDRMKQRQKELQQSLAPDRGAVLDRNAEYQRLKDRHSELNAQLTSTRRNIQCQLRRTCRTTRGALNNAQAQARILRQKVQRAGREANGLKEQLLAKESQSFSAQTATTRSELDQVAKDIKERQDERAFAIADAKRDYDAPIGLMDRHEALNSLGGERDGTAFFTWVLRGLIFFIDFIPVLFKTVTLFCRPTAAEREEEDREEKELARLEHERQRELDRAKHTADSEVKHELELQRLRQREAELEAELGVKQAESNQRLVAEGTEELQKRILAAQLEIAREVIDRWHDDARASVEQIVQQYVNPAAHGTNGNGNGAAAANGAAAVNGNGNGGVAAPVNVNGSVPPVPPAPPAGPAAGTGNGSNYARKFDRSPPPAAAGPSFVQHPPAADDDADDQSQPGASQADG